MTLSRSSPCKVNLLLNVLGRRPDGFHELETILHPIDLADRIEMTRGGSGIRLTCDQPALPTNSENLVYRAAAAFFAAARLEEGVQLHLEKRVPLSAGLGGGSSNAAATLRGLNQLFECPLSEAQLEELAKNLGSDVPFFLQDRPALGTGRGEIIEPLEFFPALAGAYFLLIHPGFGVSTPWAYRQLSRFPAALQGQVGRARRLMERLRQSDLRGAGADFYNSLEAPVLEKYPLLAEFQDFLRAQGAVAALMSGSGSTTFAVLSNRAAAEQLGEQFRARFGESYWMAIVAARSEATA
jgi:4-diphosphocytidyl-2-C-methyl-D-erythritol kinase